MGAHIGYVRPTIAFDGFTRLVNALVGHARPSISLTGYAPPEFDFTAVYPPVNTVAPVASGTPDVGQTLSCTTGTWDNSPTSYSYQWRRDAVNIAGATSNTYTLVEADAETDVDCVVTATNLNSSVNADSNDITVNPIVNDLTDRISIQWTSGTGTWVGIEALALVTTGGDNLFADLTFVTSGPGKTFSDISAGQYITDTTYAQSYTRAFNTWSGVNPHWNGNGHVLTVFMKFSSPVSKSDLASLQIVDRRPDLYSLPIPVIKDQDGNVIPITSYPANATDFNGDATIDGVTSGEPELFKWSLQ